MTIPRKYRKLFQDSIVVEIPLNGKTADLGVALKRTRAKRISSLYKEFPSLNKKKQTASSPNNENVEAQDDEGNQGQDDDKEHPQRKKSKVVDETLPQREQYGSVVDYLEAKYVRGVMLGDEIDENEASDRESVYSEDSWLDDSLLKRDVAEQVLSHETQTKVGVENDDEDDFFVNVGNLEVEDNDLMNYDPTQDEKAVKKQPKKRKRSDAGSTKSGKTTKSTPKKKSDTSTTTKSAKKKDTPKSSDGPSKPMSEELAAIKKKAEQLGAEVKAMFDTMVTEIKGMSDDDLPRRNKLVKVTLMIPEGKKPSDALNFANPHVPGQMLKAAVPKGKGPGDKFDVKVPAPAVADEGDKNKFSREFQESAAQFSSKYDEWVHAEAEFHAADPDQKGKFPLKNKKVAKFEEVIKAFPSNLVTPVDGAYMKKIVRRARQNRKKRKDDDEAVASIAKAAPAAASAAKPDTKPSPKQKAATKLDVKSLPKANKHTLLKAVKPVKPDPKPEAPKTIEILLPSMGRVFRQHELRHDIFESMTRE